MAAAGCFLWAEAGSNSKRKGNRSFVLEEQIRTQTCTICHALQRKKKNCPITKLSRQQHRTR